MNAPPRPSPHSGKPRDGDHPPPAQPEEPPRPMYTAGGMAAATAAGIGLAVLVTFTLIGWVAAPHDTLGEDIADVVRTAVQGWLVGHLVGFAIPGGHVSMLPLGLVVLPGLLLIRSGRWLARSCGLCRPRQLFRAALAIAGPYAAISGTLALVGQNDVVRPSVPQALLAGFLLAFVAGGLGVLRQILKDQAISKRRLVELIPERPRSLFLGTLGATGVLLFAGAGLFCVALVAGFGDVVAITQELSPGAVGGVLLVLGQILYLPNAVVFGASYAVGPGFAVGTGTMVAPMGVAVGPLPLFPMLGVLPENGPVPVYSLVALAAPFLAGVVGGILTQRSAPAATGEAVPMWGLACGATTGLVCAALAALAGGPVGAERLSDVGPSPWQVGLITTLEVGVAAAITAWLANWRYHRRTRVAGDTGARRESESGASGRAPAGPVEAAPSSVRARRRGRVRLPALRRRRAGEEAEELFGITYEAGPDASAPGRAPDGRE